MSSPQNVLALRKEHDMGVQGKQYQEEVPGSDMRRKLAPFNASGANGGEV
jgi:hypothetical protein